jgi:hypothetical protein
MRSQCVDIDLHLVENLFETIFDFFGTWNLEDVELHVFLVALELVFFVEQLFVEISMGQRICGIMVVGDEFHGSLLLKVQV